MNPMKPLVLLIASGCVLLCAALPSRGSQEAGADERYVCPPCPVDCHEATYARPGSCATCGMTLVNAATVPQIAILVWEGCDLLSFAGPTGALASSHCARLFTVADTTDPIKSQDCVFVVPQFAFEDAPKPDVLIVPSGGDVIAVAGDQLVTDWIRSAAGDARFVLGVGTGAVLLAEAGLLDGQEVAVHPRLAEYLKQVAPDAVLRTDRAVADNGKILIARGAAPAIDLAFEIVEELEDRDAASTAAERLRFDWSPQDTGR